MGKFFKQLRLVPTLVAALVLATIPAAGLAPAALAADTGSISGKVTVPAGVDATKIRVDARGPNGNFVETIPLANGSYVIGGLAAGQYTVGFEHVDAPNASPVIGTYYPGASYFEAAAITVTAGSAVTGIDQVLEAGAIISGKISVPTGSPRFTGYVEIMKGPNYTGYANAGTYGATDYVGDVDDSGSFSISGLAPGTYKVRYSSYADEWATMWRGRVAAATSSPEITVTKGQQVSGLADLAIGAGTIQGTVTGGDEAYQCNKSRYAHVIL